ncbi:MAG: response regulator [bacterium]|nr:response regulator [bacterium]
MKKIENNKILIVDDDEAILDFCRSVLEYEKFEVFSAENGERALQILNAQSIRVVFTDLNMPEMSGFDICSRIKKSNPEILCYAITGYPVSFKLPEFKEAGFDGYLMKPFKMSQLIQLVRVAAEKLARVE